MRHSILVLVACLTVGSVRAATIGVPANKLDAYLDALEHNGFTNGSVAISGRGKLLYRRSLGNAVFDARGDSATDAGTRYRVGSVTKLFTAVLAMQLAEQARLTLDGPVAEFFPDLPNALNVSYRAMLRHRSGLAHYTSSAEFRSRAPQPVTRDAVLALITRLGAQFPPGERVQYSNANYYVLGAALEKVFERPYEDVVIREIAAKIGLARTYYGERPDPANHEAVSYDYRDGAWRASPVTDQSWLRGAGGMVSSPEDLVRFIDALFAGTLVSAQSLSTMRAQEGGSGVGLWPYTIGKFQGLGAAGSIDAFRACVYTFPDQGISIAFATNASLLPMDEIVGTLLGIVLDKAKAPAFAPQKLAAGAQSDYLGTWRSQAGEPHDTPFRGFITPDAPLEFSVTAGNDAPVIAMEGKTFPLTAYGDGEFLARGSGDFFRFYPRRDEAVMRNASGTFYLTRAR